MNETNEHNPDGLTPEQYGAPEWRLLKRGETPDIGDEADMSARGIRWEKVETRFDGPINIRFVCAYRRRVSPTLAEQSQRRAEGSIDAIADQPARIAELERRVEELTEENKPQPEAQSHEEPDGCPTEGARLRREWKQQSAELSQLRAEVERLTKERDEARAELTSSLGFATEALGDAYQSVSISVRENIAGSIRSLRAQLAEREEDRAAAVREASIERERAGTIKAQNLHLVEIINELKAAIKNAPHGKNCDLNLGLCNCWKANL